MRATLHRWRVEIALAALWIAGSVAMGARHRQRALHAYQAESARLVASVRAEVEETIATAREDVLILARSPALRADDAEALRELFRVYAASRSGVHQVRLLDTQGRERIRVERSGDDVLLAEDLQDKSDRYYFREAISLPHGQVYVSPIDLNVEYGRVEDPPRPTVRLAAPVQVDGRPRGVVVINLAADMLLDRVERLRQRAIGTLVLVDRDGVYISHPDPAAQWGGPEMLATGRGLPADHPHLAAWLWDGDETASVSQDGLVATRAEVPSRRDLPRALLVTEQIDALSRDLAGFVPVILTSGVTGVLIVVVAYGRRRRQRLQDELSRETALREAIAASERELRSAQERLVASARLAGLSASAAALAHELRNPMGAIVNAAGLLRADESIDAESRDLLGIVVGEGKRLERAIHDFLELARPSTPRPEAIDLVALVEEVVALARHDPVCGEGLTLALERERGAAAVRADSDELRQVLWNLLRNAGSATRSENGERVTIRIVDARLDGSPAVGLEVIDEGPGPPPDSPEIWPTRGTGVGLIVVAGVVARHGGRFSLAEGPSRRGAIARVVLPAIDAGVSLREPL